MYPPICKSCKDMMKSTLETETSKVYHFTKDRGDACCLCRSEGTMYIVRTIQSNMSLTLPMD